MTNFLVNRYATNILTVENFVFNMLISYYRIPEFVALK